MSSRVKNLCERYVLPEQTAAEHEFNPRRSWWKFSPRFNVCTHQYVPAVRLHQGESEAVMLRWGLIPAWAEGKPPVTPAPCVDVEQLETPWFRDAWSSGQRCILPIAGFYIWQLTRAGYRQPYFVCLTDRSVFGVAALWDRSVEDDDDVIESCSLVCVPVNDLMAKLDPGQQRMPAILKRRDYAVWLQGSGADARATLEPYHASRMRAHPVSPRINSRAVDDAGLIRPVQALCS